MLEHMSEKFRGLVKECKINLQKTQNLLNISPMFLELTDLKLCNEQ